MKRYALHGFLGSPSDWDGFGFEALPLELAPFSEWSTAFNARYSGHIIGYSLGGRLALHALLANPSQWESAVIISANPNAGDTERLERDEVWARKFETLPWDALMQEWNAQAIFNDFLPRPEGNRQLLASQLRIWSAGRQQQLPVETLSMPILWVVGEKDPRAVRPILKHPGSKVIVVPNCGHRVPFEKPSFLKNRIEEWQHALTSGQLSKPTKTSDSRKQTTASAKSPSAAPM